MGGIVSGRCARPGVRIRALARALGIVALGLVGFWLVAHLLWMGPLETAAQTTAMWALGLLTGGVGVAAAVLGCALIVVGLVHYRNTEPSGEIPPGGAGHGRAGRLGRRPLVARADPALSVTEERHGSPAAPRALGGVGAMSGPPTFKKPRAARRRPRSARRPRGSRPSRSSPCRARTLVAAPPRASRRRSRRPSGGR